MPRTQKDINAHRYGTLCDRCLPDRCDKTKGICHQCKAGFSGKDCRKTGCPRGKYGKTCSLKCPPNCARGCHFDSGKCLTGCRSGFLGDMCNVMCDNGFYGKNCNFDCGDKCGAGKSCHPVTGQCLFCKFGHVGSTCNSSSLSGQMDEGEPDLPSTSKIIMSSVMSLLALGIVIWAFFVCISILKQKMINDEMKRTGKEAPAWVTRESTYRGKFANLHGREQRQFDRRQRNRRRLYSIKMKKESESDIVPINKQYHDTASHVDEIKMQAKLENEARTQNVNIYRPNRLFWPPWRRRKRRREEPCLADVRTQERADKMDKCTTLEAMSSFKEASQILQQIPSSVFESEKRRASVEDKESSTSHSTATTSDASGLQNSEDTTTAATSSRDDQISYESDWASSTKESVTESAFNQTESTIPKAVSSQEETRELTETVYSDSDEELSDETTNQISSSISANEDWVRQEQIGASFPDQISKNESFTFSLRQNKANPTSRYGFKSKASGNNKNSIYFSTNGKNESKTVAFREDLQYKSNTSYTPGEAFSDHIVAMETPLQASNQTQPNAAAGQATHQSDAATKNTNRFKNIFSRYKVMTTQRPKENGEGETPFPPRHYSGQFLLSRLAVWQDEPIHQPGLDRGDG